MVTSTLVKVFAGIGAVWVSRWILNITRFLYTFLRPSSLSRYHHLSPTGAPPYALITGASDGIGKGYAFELARQNFNLILHGRNKSKLLSVSSAIKNIYPDTIIRIVISDATQSGDVTLREINEIVEQIKDLHITILINNVGTGTRPSGHVFSNFESDDPADLDALINVNARFPIQFTRQILPLLFSHSQPTLLLTMASISEIGSPYLSVYSATKAFMKAWSCALAREFKAEGRDVEVLAIMTAQVTGTATEGMERNVFVPDARCFARSALGRVGCGGDVVEGWWSHAVLRGVMGRLPGGVFTGILTRSVRGEMGKVGKSK
ncbi:NAD(P)-binding Rossmann-fold containing protein [Glarea lozoyensis ATCC 20868]|uniref:NAD(P)-binding Rossmann-fold containing protein n=1 Tax=Glarea lozoyensis (strain ATCC 20868 / MF5171) TaxID=1116229 RepID=S3DHH1_GLAL2|nr:NAD(P)-binding Rossmann-fold containing protein [Glarea lozoyensis ATCC 20868]EPE36599.1 NAD(P)-binding Rossmann-fold containing protein [Glarea lozoyensis ATCC 20868]